MPRPTLIAALLLLGLTAARAHSEPSPAQEMAVAARAWLDSLALPQRQQAVYPLADAERENWHFVPRDRHGLPLKSMSPAQQQLARQLVAAGLSERGLLTTDAIIALEDVLFAMEGATRRDRGLYYFTVFGVPDDHGTWGWRLEGHHLSVNILIADGSRIAVTPMFFGSNPAEVRITHAQQGRRALAAEEDLGRSLVRSLDPEQLTVALIADHAPADIITGNDREAQLAHPTGLPFASMTPAQQEHLRALVAVYAGRLRPEIATAELQRIADRGWHQVHFAWAGSLTPRQPHYYRIHSPDFVIEYDNIQNDSNHIHTTWRNFTGDFGRDLLREHREHDHAAGK
ncbi:hypothetical protein Verru16b_02281 [Lacunisphaera limnophila]|uniref:DUF3500 domain-containing protein n=1 Tax=Lacunisphaera limnophila TaxID=1838286 RepID=A0A1D8AWE5_9BACT|nr:DUF3500 domain-containing protein [Lacunisphaera limnophila]AOS45203.1 hypothetical protein Verru16b_02281 [Lacunisphaera limnophila]